MFFEKERFVTISISCFASITRENNLIDGISEKFFNEKKLMFQNIAKKKP